MHGITLTKAPADWEILQQENGKATVALKGNFQVHPAAIEVGVERVTPVVRVMSEDDNMTVIPWTNADHFTCNEKFQGEFEVTLEIPAGAYDAEDIQSRRSAGAVFRRTSKAALLFADGHTGEADWRRYGGEAQPEDQKILLCLREGDRIGYRVENLEEKKLRIDVHSYGDGTLNVQNMTAQQGLVWVSCNSGIINVESLHITIEE